MNRTDCENERLSSKAVGMLIIVFSLLLLSVGWILLPVVGFIFALPLIVLGIGMILSPQSKTCRLVMDGLHRR